MKKRYIYAFPKMAINILFDKKSVQYDFILEEKNAVLLSSGRAAVYNAVKILSLKKSDVVLVPAYHCGVEIEALIKAGVRICYYRITRDMAVDKEDLERKTDDDVKALFIIHYWGFPQDIAWITGYCKDRKIILIEDSAHALYSKFQGRLLGTSGEVGIYSLSKTLAVPNGGILFTKRDIKNINIVRSRSNRQAFKAAARSTLENACNLELTPFAWLAIAILSFKRNNDKRSNIERGRYLDDPLNQYEEGISILSKYLLNYYNAEMIVNKRRQNYFALLRYLSGLEGIEILFKNVDEGVCPLFFPIVIEDRLGLEQYLLQNRIETYVFGRNLHPTLEIKDYPESNFLSDHVLGLPIHQGLTEDDMENIVKKMDVWNFARGRI